jgi:hypothetical protein
MRSLPSCRQKCGNVKHIPWKPNKHYWAAQDSYLVAARWRWWAVVAETTAAVTEQRLRLKILESNVHLYLRRLVKEIWKRLYARGPRDGALASSLQLHVSFCNNI